jgi:hypothetical protein
MRPLPHAVLATVALFALFAAAPAQETARPFRASDFLPADFTNLVQLDLVAIRDCELLGVLRAGMAGLMLAEAEQAAGIPFDAIDRLTLVPVLRPADAERGGSAFDTVMVIEGNRELPVPPWASAERGYAVATIGGHEVRARRGFRDALFLRPRPATWVTGDAGLLEPILAKKGHAGLPEAELMSLTAGRDRALFTLVMHLAEEPDYPAFLERHFPDREWAAAERPEYLRLRLVAQGDPDDPEFVMQGALRHAAAGDGVATSERAFAELLQRAKQEPEFRAFRGVLAAVTVRQDGNDLVAEANLGRGRAAAGTLAMALVPMLMLRAVDVPATAPAPVPAEPKKQ